jgi:amino acid transporter
LAALIFYGVGDMLGAGIYALTGKVAGILGHAAWIAFAVSLVAASLTALSYASLGSRYPKAGGAAYVTQRAFGQPFLSYLVGLAVLCSGLTSMAAGANAFAGYFVALAGGPPAPVVMLVYLGVLTLVNLAGMRQSSRLNVLFTLVELSGIVIVIAVSLRYWGGADYLRFPPAQEGGAGPVALVLQGGALAFFAFIGFEDLLNVSEEAKNPRRDIPIALLVAVAVATVLYMGVALSAVSVLSPDRLAASPQPLVDVVLTAAPGFPKGVFSAIALFAIANTALVNHLMGSRLLFGMGRQGLVPKALGRVHAYRGTPALAILVVSALVVALMFSGGVRELASATSSLLLFVFIIVNGAQLVLRRKEGEPRGLLELPAAVPFAGIIVCAAMLVHTDAAALKIAFLILVGITVLYVLVRPKAPVGEGA